MPLAAVPLAVPLAAMPLAAMPLAVADAASAGPLTATVPTSLLLALLLGAVRAAAWLLLAPPFSSRAVPGSVKALLSVALALPMAPGLATSAPAADPAALATAVVWQVVIGAGLGFACYLVFVAVQAAGDLIDLFGGFTLASAFDPMMQSTNAVFGRFYAAAATTLLLVTDAHRLVLHGFLRTYRLLPLDATFSLSTMSHLLTSGVTQLMLAALQIAGPLIAVLFLADVGLGLLTKVAPALNAFSMGFPVKILMTLTLGGFAFATLPGTVHGIGQDVVHMLGTLVKSSVATAGSGSGG